MTKNGEIELIISRIVHSPPVKKESELMYDDMVSFSRPFLGNQGVILWRLLRRLVMPKFLGKLGSSKTSFLMAKQLGKMLPAKNIPELLNVGADLNIGVFRIVAQEKNRILISSDECITCSGTPNIGRAVCDFELGIFAGALEKITRKKTTAKEVKCNGLGDGICWLDYKLS